MSYDICGAKWDGKDGKPDHACYLLKDHTGKYICACGHKERVANPFQASMPKTYYKRKKGTQ